MENLFVLAPFMAWGVLQLRNPRRSPSMMEMELSCLNRDNPAKVYFCCWVGMGVFTKYSKNTDFCLNSCSYSCICPKNVVLLQRF